MLQDEGIRARAIYDYQAGKYTKPEEISNYWSH